MLHFFIFYIFSLIKNILWIDDLRVACLNDGKGKNMKGESLFLNLYDYWMRIHAEYKSLFEWYNPKIAILEKKSRKKLKDVKDLSLAHVF